MNTTRTNSNPCFECGYSMDAHTLIGLADTPKLAAPKPGDLGLCLNCGAIAMFGENLVPRRPTELEMSQIDQVIRGILKRGQFFIRQRGRFDETKSTVE